jgi:hypothetical protein
MSGIGASRPAVGLPVAATDGDLNRSYGKVKGQSPIITAIVRLTVPIATVVRPIVPVAPIVHPQRPRVFENVAICF